MPCCSANRVQRSSAITSIRLETERFSKAAICSNLFRCSSRTVRLSFALFLFFLDFAIRAVFYTSFFITYHAGEKYTLKTRRRHNVLLTYAINTYQRRIRDSRLAELRLCTTD